VFLPTWEAIMARWLVAAVLALAALGFADDKAKKLPLVFEDDFAGGARNWEPTDPAGWKVIDTPKGKAYSQFVKASSYKPPVRSPFHRSLVKGLVVSDLVLEADVQSTVKDYGHRDVCLFFGYQDPSHFYYVHLGKKADDHANQIFIVNAKPRTKISTTSTPGTPWDDAWHHVKVVRRVGDGTIAVYFDDMKKPVMTATDKTFTWGRVGVGSFDDTSNWRNVKVRGVRVKPPGRGK
jgi:hypothetical protein